MDRETLRRDLALAEKYIAQGERHVSRQRQIVQRLQRQARDATEAQQVLEQLLLALDTHVAHRRRILQELGVASFGL
jgi:hypothetical protein